MVTGEANTKDREVPGDLTGEEAKELQNQADEVVTALVNAKGVDVLTFEDKISNVGVKDQKAVSGDMALLQEKMGKVFYSENKSSVTANMSKDISELQGILAKINPKDLEKEARYRLLKLVPFLGNYLVTILRASSAKRVTLQEFVDHLGDSLKTGETMLRQDNAQLKVMYSEIESQRQLISKDAFFAEVLMDNLQAALESSSDGKIKSSLQKTLFKVSTRAQDLRAMENIHEQFFVSIEMTRDNNDSLILTVQRMLTMGMNVVYVAFAIHSALARQKDVIEAARGTRDFLGNMIVSNAEMINSHVKEIGDLYKEPVVAMDKLSKAVEELKEAMEATGRMKAEAIEAARENITRIKVMTEEIRDKAGVLPDSDVKSLEASSTLLLKEGTSKDS